MAADAYVKIANNMPQHILTASVLRRIMIRTVGERDLSIQEGMYQIQSLNLHNSSFKVITASLEGSRNIKSGYTEGDVALEPIAVDHYAHHSKFQHMLREINSTNFVNLVINYYIVDDEIRHRKGEVIVRTLPCYSGNPESPHFWKFCKYQLLKYKPWKNNSSNAWGDQPENPEIVVAAYSEFLSQPTTRVLMPSCATEMENLEYYSNGSAETDENDVYGSNFSDEADNENIQGRQYWIQRSLVYNESETGNMPSWIISRKADAEITPVTSSSCDISSSSEEQRRVYNIVLEKFHSSSHEQLLLIVIGQAGTGKSYFINAIRELLSHSCVVLAFFGIALFNVPGSTLHNFMKLPNGVRRNDELKGEALAQIQERCIKD